MRFELLSIGFMEWWAGLWFGKDDAKVDIFVIKIAVFGIGIRVFGVSV